MNKILDFIVGRFSCFSISWGDLKTLMHFSKDKDLVVELGTCMGTTTECFARNGVKKVVTIDVFEKLDLIESEGEHQGYKKNFLLFPHTFASVKDRLKQYLNIEVYQGRSYEMSHLCQDNSVDMIFIDADHSYKGAQKDYESWFDKVKVGGIFLFHDVVPTFAVFKYYGDVLKEDNRIKEIVYTPEMPTSAKAFRKL